jgi:hypothetical protein
LPTTGSPSNALADRFMPVKTGLPVAGQSIITRAMPPGCLSARCRLGGRSIPRLATTGGPKARSPLLASARAMVTPKGTVTAGNLSPRVLCARGAGKYANRSRACLGAWAAVAESGTGAGVSGGGMRVRRRPVPRTVMGASYGRRGAGRIDRKASKSTAPSESAREAL